MDMRGADLPLLLSLDVLIEEANVTRAAARLHISQPAMSAQLSRLRELFGDALLVPAESGRGMAPTARALQLREPLRAALRQLDAVVRMPDDFVPATAQRTFHVVANDNVTVMLCLNLMRTFEGIGNPGLRLALHNLPRDTVVPRMERGELDLMVGSARFMPEPLRARPLLRDDFMVARRKGHPRGAAAPSLDEYCAAGHVIISPQGGFRSFVDDHLERLGRRRRVALSLPHYNLAPPALAVTDYLCTLPSRFLRRYADTLDAFALPFELPPFAAAIGWHPRSDNDAGHRWLRELLIADAA